MSGPRQRWVASLSESDLADLRRREIRLDELERQVELFTRPPRFARLVRPCTVDDGIRRLDRSETEELHELHRQAAAAGRFSKFVPASGAASRMFRDLLFFLRGPGRGAAWNEVAQRAARGDARASTLVAFFDGCERFAFYDDLCRTLRARGQDPEQLRHEGRYDAFLAALLDEGGLGYEQLPKGLLKFHASPDGGRTPFEEHLVEAAHYARDADGNCRLHFTVSPEHRAGFEALLERMRPVLSRTLGVRFQVDYSVQKRSTDTLAVDLDNRPLRDDEGRLMFRPGGHGALIENLDDLGGDLVYIKNIDNVQPDRRKQQTLHWKKSLGGYLVKLQRRCHEILARLREERPSAQFVDRGLRFAATRLQVELNGQLDARSPEMRRSWLIDRLSRPLRVCGVVPNTGEPGGGPYWVRDPHGTVANQIIEAAQVDPEDGEQQNIFAAATHFNPVDLVCALRDGEGRPFDLRRFVDPDAVLVSTKSSAGRELRALERPGLWNGAMAGWNTVFVEVPLETFSPVKTVLDLLRPEHQTA